MKEQEMTSPLVFRQRLIRRRAFIGRSWPWRRDKSSQYVGLPLKALVYCAGHSPGIHQVVVVELPAVKLFRVCDYRRQFMRRYGMELERNMTHYPGCVLIISNHRN
jgi:hypothetical protein